MLDIKEKRESKTFRKTEEESAVRSGFDVIIIGGGVVGCAIARELSRYRLKIGLLEKNLDVGYETSGRNTGVCHGGFAYDVGTWKAKLCLEGNRIMGDVARELSFPFKRCGKVLVGNTQEDYNRLLEVIRQGEAIGVTGLSMIDDAELHCLIPGVVGNFAMLSETSGILDPFQMTIALAENAVQNGASFFFGQEVTGIRREGDAYVITTPKETFVTRWVVNSAGLSCGKISDMLGLTGYRVIYSKDDLVLNGKGTLSITSSDNGISGKDDIKITGGTINITSASDAIEANDSIVMSDGNITINSEKDGLHAENDEDDSVGYIYIGGGSITINASSDAIQATTILQIDNGTVTTNSSEGLEATYVQINGGTINVTASDDGINASNKSNAYTVTAEFNGGEINIDMGQGDTDAIDSNGNLYVNGGTFNITGQSAFDFDGQCEYNGGTIYVNGELTTEITNQMMGGGMGGPGGGDMGGAPGGMR